MSEVLGQMTYERERNQFLPGSMPSAQGREFSEETAREIDCAVRALLGSAFERAREILTTRRPRLEAGARRLLEQETLSAAELEALLDIGSA